jgi:hypothetical protein
MELRIDASDVLRLAGKLDGADRVIQRHLVAGVTKAGLLVEGRAKGNAPVKTGTLRRSITTRATSLGSGAQAIVGTNVPYAKWVEEGRGPVVARGRALRFEAGGTVIFRKRVGPAAGRWYMRRAFRSSEGQIRAILQQAAADAAAEVLA